MEAFRHCWGMSAPTGRIDLPDSEIASAAKQFVYDISPAFVAHHSLRSYLYGRELAAAKGLRPDVDYDDELVFLSCMLHDLGVTEDANGDHGSKSTAPMPPLAFCVSTGCRKRRSPRPGRRLRCTPVLAWRTSSVRSKPSPRWASR